MRSLPGFCSVCFFSFYGRKEISKNFVPIQSNIEDGISNLSLNSEFSGHYGKESSSFENEADPGRYIDDGDNLSPEEQLRRLEEEKEVYNRLQRMVRRSAKYELPRVTVSTKSIFPPANNIKKLDNPKGGDSDGVYGDESVNSPAPQEDRTYKPVKVLANANTTLELITSIVQIPNCKNVKGVTTSFRIKDYTEDNDEPILEEEIWLKEVNKRRHDLGMPDFPLELKKGKSLMDNKEFVSEVRQIQLDKAKRMRERAQKSREERKKARNTFYTKLPKDERGYRQLTSNDVPKLTYEELREELKNRGYRTSGDERTLRKRLLGALKENSEWRYRNIVSQPLREDNENLPKHARERLAEIKEKIKFVQESYSSNRLDVMIERLRTKNELLQFREDPVGYLNLDGDELIAHGLSAEEAKSIEEAPVVYDTYFFDEIQKPINRLPDILTPTFNLQPDSTRVVPEVTSMDELEIEGMKREYLDIRGGIHEQTLPDISKRFEISMDFLGDACCRLGAKAPVAKDLPLRALISYSAIWDLLQYLNIADTMEVDLYYSPFTIGQMAEEFQKPLEGVIEACNMLEIKLPFGAETKLNLHCQSAVEQLLTKGTQNTDFEEFASVG